MASVDMFYALIGCFMFAYLNATVGDGYRKLGQAICVAVVITVYMFVMNYFSSR
jgi:hypothetical protein